MSYRRETRGSVWHWCRNCPEWPSQDFQQREDKPVTWTGQTLCDQCDGRALACTCQHSVSLRTGLASDQVLGPLLNNA